MTIYEVLKQSGVSFTVQDITEIGVRVKAEIKPIGVVRQTEKWGDKENTISVNSYCQSEADEIQGIIIEYFQQKLAQ